MDNNSATSLSHPKYRADIDGIRAIAVIAVVLFHAFPETFGGGFVGVDVFFVISGYLISSLIRDALHSDRFSFREFYARRIRRIFPSLICVLAACLILGWFALLADEYSQLGEHVAGGAGFASNIVLWSEMGYFNNAAELKPLLHLWSLGIEEQFYIVWPMLLFLAWKRRISLFSMTCVLLGLSFALNMFAVHDYATATFYWPVTRFWELLIGCAFALFNRKQQSTSTRGQDLRAWSGLLAVGFAVFVLNGKMPYPGWLALLPTLGTLLLISAPTAWLNRTVLSHRAVVWFGLISYPLYLWHWPLLSFAQILKGDRPEAGLRIILVCLSIPLAWLTYRVIEKPIRFSGQTTWKTAGLVLAMSLVGLAGFQVYASQGYRSRLTKNAAGIFDWNGLNSNPECEREPKFPKLSYCYWSIPNTPPTVVLAGDSHADAYFWGINDFYKAKHENLLLLAEGGCVPFWDLSSFVGKAPDVCRELMNGTLNFALQTASVDTVILASRGPLYTTGHGFGDVEFRDNTLRLATDPDNHDYLEVYALAMDRTLKRFVEANKKVIFVIDIPELGFSPKSCVDARNVEFFKSLKSPCAVPRAEVDARNAPYLYKIREVLKRYPAVRTFDPGRYLCDEKYCWATTGGKLLYRDDNHLSFDGSLFVGSKFALEF